MSSFEKIITENYVYIDKTKHIDKLVNKGAGRYFLSRPRRFGKSLLIDTIKQAFQGNRELFKGLHLEKNWDWEVIYPVLHFSFGEGNISNPQLLDEKISTFLDTYYKRYNVEQSYSEISSKFSYLINTLGNKYQQVVILIDEYDKPILDNIDNSDLAIAMRQRLKNFYSVIKAQDEYIKFVMLTGVSKFSKVSLFSDLNNLKDITVDAKYADICGYTQLELEVSFKAHLDQGDVDRNLLRSWYNGYNFAGSDKQKVYNPFDILLFIDEGYHYQNYWFETATPTFLIKMIEKYRYFIPNLENAIVGEDVLKTFDIDNMPIETLLFQTGYLTIKEMFLRGHVIAYLLSYPNYEVKYSLNNSLAMIATNDSKKNQVIDHMISAFEKNNFERLGEIICSHFASIPHDWYRNNDIERYEGSSRENEEYCSSPSDVRSTEQRAGIQASQDALGEGFYAGIVYSFLAALGYDLIAEDVTNHGKIDLTLVMPDKVLIIEFKLQRYGDAKEAVAQIKSRQYAQKYESYNKPIYLIGMSFDDKQRNMADLAVERF
ncbi:ATP-binding protein [Cysteiniphilum marinum]|uniref:ATP-binding protein n=1 Tax=Cysteiniphilum marinum TaxID=2774191 RepID=UPI002E2B038C|nr:ATP-binding protein [Cysteiniphilum marinum]